MLKYDIEDFPSKNVGKFRFSAIMIHNIAQYRKTQGSAIAQAVSRWLPTALLHSNGSIFDNDL
jgi:hypothetical protein